MSLSPNSSSEVRVRFAPSPTGYLHVGGARTALYNWLYAKKKGGKFILRIEDTDQARSTEEALNMQVSDLKWLGLTWDEGYDIGGEYGPYRQSERLRIYKEKAEELIEAGKAYYCFCTDQELEEKKEIAKKEGRPPHYDGKCRSLNIEESRAKMKAGATCTVRFKVDPTKAVSFKDLIRNEVTFPAGMVGDFIILRSDGMPVYNFCCTVDDSMMKITHVLRAEEHLPNTLRQIMLYEALNEKIPDFGHLSIILGEDKQKLSKRHGATSCNEFKNKGYLPEALLNFIALLGWSSPNGDEILTIEELIKQFDLDRMVPSSAVFDQKKFNWVNATHLRALPSSELWERLKVYLDENSVEYKKDPEWQKQAVETLKSSMETFMDGVELFKLLDDAFFDLTQEGLETIQWKEAKPVIEAWIEALKDHPHEAVTEAEFGEIQNKVKEKSGQKGKFLFMPMRVCVIGKPHGTELKLLVPLLDKSALIRRAEKCLSKI
jgi:nondiscriminating glutamyl-tRNA synthetase